MRPTAARSPRPGSIVLGAVLLAGAFGLAAAQGDAPPTPPGAGDAPVIATPPAGTRLALTVEPREATVGEVLQATLILDLDADARFDPPNLGPALGPFDVIDAAWKGPETTADGRRWTWSGRLAVYRTGEHELPSVGLSVRRDGTAVELASEPVPITITSVLPAAEPGTDEPELAELKPPASIPPDFGPLRAAVGVLLLLLLISLVAWWLHRRYADRLAAAAVPDDPFHRIPPHVWVYGALQKLLERRLPEEGRIEEFYSELAHILKRYLSGRYRVDLLERTTEEVPPALRQTGAPEASIHDTEDVLREADRVKFAKERPGPSHWKAGVEVVYRIVDRTKPVDVAPPAEQRGAA